MRPTRQEGPCWVPAPLGHSVTLAGSLSLQTPSRAKSPCFSLFGGSCGGRRCGWKSKPVPQPRRLAGVGLGLRGRSQAGTAEPSRPVRQPHPPLHRGRGARLGCRMLRAGIGLPGASEAQGLDAEWVLRPAWGTREGLRDGGPGTNAIINLRE